MLVLILEFEVDFFMELSTGKVCPSYIGLMFGKLDTNVQGGRANIGEF
jgi:hypothetical protein